jgi:hypothetical protein
LAKGELMKIDDTNDLTLSYKGKSVAVLTEAEIVNNTNDGLIQTGYLLERFIEVARDLGMFKDVYHPVRDV